MKSKLGFTLIELLVVVLIIGILAAIALPQYKKAVEKSKASQALTLLQSAYQAAMLYQVATGNYPSSIEELDVDIPSDFKGGGEWVIDVNYSIDAGQFGIGMTRTQGKYAGTGFFKFKEHPYSAVPKETNLCFENRKGSTYIFNGTLGSYCEKIFNGKPKYVNEKVWAAIWALP